MPLSQALEAGLERDKEPNRLALFDELRSPPLNHPLREGLGLDPERRKQPWANTELLGSTPLGWSDPALLDHEVENKSCALVRPLFCGLFQRIETGGRLHHAGQQRGLVQVEVFRFLAVESRTGAVAWAMRQHPVSRPRSSNRTCGLPASGFPTGFTARHTAAAQDARVEGAARRVAPKT